MDNPINYLKQALRDGQQQFGLWLGLNDPASAEICAGAGFDWLLIDGEHTPHSLNSIAAQLRAISGYPATQAAARVPSSDPLLLKQYLDLGIQTLLVPMVESAAQAASIVRACLYPPQGERGVGGGRAARWGHIPTYLHDANEQIAIIVQIETQAGLDELDAIVQTDGVDGVFIGPADLAASLGHLGKPHEIQSEILDAVGRIRAAGKAPGILSRDPDLVRLSIEHGAQLVAVGLDAYLLAAQARALAKTYIGG